MSTSRSTAASPGTSASSSAMRTRRTVASFASVMASASRAPQGSRRRRAPSRLVVASSEWSERTVRSASKSLPSCAARSMRVLSTRTREAGTTPFSRLLCLRECNGSFRSARSRFVGSRSPRAGTPSAIHAVHLAFAHPQVSGRARRSTGLRGRHVPGQRRVRAPRGRRTRAKRSSPQNAHRERSGRWVLYDQIPRRPDRPVRLRRLRLPDPARSPRRPRASSAATTSIGPTTRSVAGGRSTPSATAPSICRRREARPSR